MGRESYIPKTRLNSFIHRTLHLKGELDSYSGRLDSDIAPYVKATDTRVERVVSLLEQMETVESAVMAKAVTAGAPANYMMNRSSLASVLRLIYGTLRALCP